MKFAFFHLMPYTHTTVEPQDWPVANKAFDPEKGTELYKTYLDTLVYAEECGFDWIGCNEHHMSPFGLMSNPNIIGAALIPRTSKAKLAIVGNLIPLVNPIRVAEEYAMLDVMSGGRLLAGMLRGIPHEYVAYNIAGDESRGRLIEAMALIRKAWTEPEPFGWEGEYYQFRAVSIWPRPRQRPHPPIIMSGSNEASARLAGEMGATLGIAAVSDLKGAKKQIEAYKDAARSAGWEPKPENVLIGMICHVAESSSQAKEELESGRQYFQKVLTGGVRTAQRLVLQKTRYYAAEDMVEFKDVRIRFGATVQEQLDNGTMLCGTPEEVVEQIKAQHAELGYGVLNVNMKIGNLPDAAILKGMKLFSQRVMPKVRNL
ncbi:MAG: LLM class flavin-dependent oxidoreductase [Alphaproteobacteria bacterium]|nr:LLM class flavin-dependent oxidoreductase [Alphaproteobacteria bacterium]